MAETKLSKDAFEFIQFLNARKVDYLLVGGWAVVIYSRPRYTGDYDFFLRRTEENAERTLAALSDFGFGSLDITKADLMKPGFVIQLGQEPNRIDLLTSIDGVDFEECFERRQLIASGGSQILVISKNDLVINKRASGRAKDLADVEALEMKPTKPRK
jgi:hypothetical protein